MARSRSRPVRDGPDPSQRTAEAAPPSSGRSGVPIVKIICVLIMLACVFGGAVLLYKRLNRERRGPRIVYRDKHKEMDTLAQEGKKLHRLKKYDAAIEKYDAATDYINKLRRSPEYQDEGYAWLDDKAAKIQSWKKQALDDKVAESGVLDAKEREKMIAISKKLKAQEKPLDATYFAGLALEDQTRAQEAHREGWRREALEKARSAVQLFEKIHKEWPDEAGKFAEQEAACRKLLAEIEKSSEGAKSAVADPK